jgi:hypothetical protein
MSIPHHHVCEANDFGPVNACGRCGLQWDSASKERRPCKPKAEKVLALYKESP